MLVVLRVASHDGDNENLRVSTMLKKGVFAPTDTDITSWQLHLLHIIRHRAVLCSTLSSKPHTIRALPKPGDDVELEYVVGEGAYGKVGIATHLRLLVGGAQSAMYTTGCWGLLHLLSITSLAFISNNRSARTQADAI